MRPTHDYYDDDSASGHHHDDYHYYSASDYPGYHYDSASGHYDDDSASGHHHYSASGQHDYDYDDDSASGHHHYDDDSAAGCCYQTSSRGLSLLCPTGRWHSQVLGAK